MSPRTPLSELHAWRLDSPYAGRCALEAAVAAITVCIAVGCTCTSSKEEPQRSAAPLQASASPTKPSPLPPPPAKDRVIEPPDGVDRQPLSPGQWVSYRMRPRTPQETELTYKVLEKEGDSRFRVELTSTKGKHVAVFQLLIDVGSSGDPADSTLAALKIKHSRAEERSYEGDALSQVAPLHRLVTQAFGRASFAGLEQEEARVPGGTFRSSFRHQGKIGVGGLQSDGTIWSHPAVPITSLVKAMTGEDEAAVELIDYGDTGAESSL